MKKNLLFTLKACVIIWGGFFSFILLAGALIEPESLPLSPPLHVTPHHNENPAHFC